MLEENKTIDSEQDTSEMLHTDEEGTVSLYAVTDGSVIPMSEVKDEVFAQKMIGDGFAMKPTSNKVLSPISGRLIEVASAKHAFYIQTKEGVKVLIHVGLDTLLLNGKGFTAELEKGMYVKQGETLVTFDGDLFEEKGYQSTIPVVILDDPAKNYTMDLHNTDQAKAGETLALTLTIQ